jgi:hypothetical protein
MAIKCINFFQSEALKNSYQIGIFGLKTNHLATLITSALISVTESVTTVSARLTDC